MFQTILCKGNNIYANSCALCSWSLCRRISCQVASKTSQMHTMAADINMHVCSLACHSSSLTALPNYCCVVSMVVLAAVHKSLRVHFLTASSMSLQAGHCCIGSCPQLSQYTFLVCFPYITAGRPLTYHPSVIRTAASPWWPRCALPSLQNSLFQLYKLYNKCICRFIAAITKQ